MKLGLLHDEGSGYLSFWHRSLQEFAAADFLARNPKVGYHKINDCHTSIFTVKFPVITARKRSLGQGNVFTSICHTVHRVGTMYDITCCLAVWSHVRSGESLPPSMGVYVGRGLSLVSLSWRPPYTVKSGRYASYLNAFLYTTYITYNFT